MLTAGACTRKARGCRGLEPVPVAAGGQGQFSGLAQSERRFFTHDKNFNDLKEWYRSCLREAHSNTLGIALLKDFNREFADEFPSLDGLPGFMARRGYESVVLSDDWRIPSE